MVESRKRSYYSMRTGKNIAAIKPDLALTLRLFRDCYKYFSEKYYFQYAFGYDCVDAGVISGILGSDIGAQMFRKLRKSHLWPIEDKCLQYSEDDLFDVVEFLYDNIAKPLEGYFHDYAGCGWHYREFDISTGRKEYRKEIDEIIADYGIGYELSEDGEILARAEIGLDELIDSQLPTYDPPSVDSRVQVAIRKFRRYRSSVDEKRDAIRDLADVLEYLRPKLSQVITKKDENDLFVIANGFGVRHHNDKQQTDYNQTVWYNWMFYYYLATIHAVIALLRGDEEDTL